MTAAGNGESRLVTDREVCPDCKGRPNIPSTRTEGGASSCAHCNRTLTFNFMRDPGGNCSCMAARQEMCPTCLGAGDVAASRGAAARGELRCDLCRSMFFEPWTEDRRRPQCVTCGHVCSHEGSLFNTIEAFLEPPVWHERRPLLTLEVQPRPPVPSWCSPYWWGNHVLTFRDEDGQPVWEAQVPHADLGSTRVERRGDCGWVIVVDVHPDWVERLLAGAAMDRTVEGSPISRWTYWPLTTEGDSTGDRDPVSTARDGDDSGRSVAP